VSGKGVAEPDEEFEAEVDQTSPAYRLAGVPIVFSALSERAKARLRTAGLPSEASSKPSSSLVGVDELGEAPAVAAALRAQCARLGLDGSPRARLPPPHPSPPRLPACTVGLSQEKGLWERFRQRCGQPVPPEPPGIPCQLKDSSGGGRVVVPLYLGSKASVSAH